MRLKYLIIVFLHIVLLTACDISTSNSNSISLANQQLTKNNAIEEKSVTYKKVQPKNIEMLQTLENGEIPGIEIGIGSKCAGILKIKGQPLEKGTENGCLYFKYNEAVYYLNSENEDEGVVCAIQVLKDIAVCGVKIGMRESEIEKILGQPDFYGPNRHNTGAHIIYQVNTDSYLIFFSDGYYDSPIQSIILSKTGLQKIKIKNTKEDYPIVEKYKSLIMDKNKQIIMRFGYSVGEMLPSELYLFNNGLLILDSQLFTEGTDKKEKFYFRAEFNQDKTELKVFFIDNRIDFIPGNFSKCAGVKLVNTSDKSITLSVDEYNGLKSISFMGWPFDEADFIYTIGPSKIEI